MGEGDEKLGAGVGILVYDATLIPNVRLRDLAIEICEKQKITYHLGTVERGGTDAGRIHLTGQGVPSISLGVPARYIHSHVSIIDRRDFESTVDLLVAVVKRLDQKTVEGLV